MKSAIFRILLSACLSWPGRRRPRHDDQSRDFTPNPADLNDLDHSYYYSWQVNWTVRRSDRRRRAPLDSNINNYDRSAISYTSSCSTRADCSRRAFRNVTEGVDNGARRTRSGAMDSADHYTAPTAFPVRPKTGPTTCTASQIQTLITDLADGTFGIGFDPDCITITTGSR